MPVILSTEFAYAGRILWVSLALNLNCFFQKTQQNKTILSALNAQRIICN